MMARRQPQQPNRNHHVLVTLALHQSVAIIRAVMMTQSLISPQKYMLTVVIVVQLRQITFTA
ncbi:hypothetical protein GN244_ATG17708 [Phytophthora infestans]|uniref:Uncharacterized protein n=1 Tax=Phytophthora infestans TaxID=4787 RepID=A0A833S8L1_PHYIN|nr:hypothetical protein GN244_ATG17708 [Phytophthora infestans]